MLIKYLMRDSRVARIFHFDAPIRLLTAGNLIWQSWQSNLDGGGNQAWLVFLQTLQRKLGLANRGKLYSDTFLYFTSQPFIRCLRHMIPSAEDYPEYLESKLKRYGLGQRRTIFWVCPNDFYFPMVRDRFQPDVVVADVIDDQRAWSSTSKYRAALSANYKEILRQSDLTFVNCNTMFNSMQSFSTNIYLFPNAAEKLWKKAASWTKPRELKRLSGPIIGYSGNLDEARLDVDLLAELALKNPSWNLVLIGSTHRSKRIFELKKIRNVYFLGVKTYEKAIRYIRYFDVAILPHLENNLTRHMNPLKLYVYLSLNVPVVTTSVADVEEFAGLVNVADSANSFSDAVARCLELKQFPLEIPRVRDWLEVNCWEKRVNNMLKLVEEKFVAVRN